MVSSTCDSPSPNTSVRMLRSLGRLNSSPMTNIRNTTPNSARYARRRCPWPAPARWARSARPPPGSPASAAASASGRPPRRARRRRGTAGEFEGGGHGAAVAARTAPPPINGTPRMPDANEANATVRRAPFDAPTRALRAGRAHLRDRGAALQALAGAPGRGFAARCSAMLACRGRVVVMGMGKSGHVGRKIAATLASTGTPAFFVHPAEASHGDLGMVTRRRRGAGHLQQRRERRAGRHPAGAAPPGRHAGGDDRQARAPRWRAMPTWCSAARSTRRPAR
jgi:hypothetical protein